MSKKFLRVLCAMMALVLVMTGIDLSFVSFARAEGSAGGSNVPATPDELLSMGEWLYWIEDGVAIVAGYTNHDESSIKVPYQLGGYPVAGIGHRAFATNSGLQSITIHTNVTSIANDAFAELDEITISAYHGSYALVYASTNNLTSQCFSSKSVSLADDVIDMAGVNAKGYRSLTDSSVTFIAKEATFLKVGQILFFPATKAFPSGLARRVSEINPTNDLLIVTLSVVELSEAFESVTGEAELFLDWDNAIYPDWVTEVRDVSSEGFGEGWLYDYYDGDVRAKKYDKELKLSITLGGEWTVEGSARFNVQTSVKSKIRRIGLFHWDLVEAEVIAESVNDYSLSLMYKGKLPPAEKRYVNLSGQNHKTSEISIPFFSALGFTGYITIELICDVSGKFEFRVQSTTVETYRYRNGKWTQSEEKPKKVVSGVAEGTFKCGPKLSVSVDWGIAGVAGITLLDMSISLYSEGKASLKTQTVWGATNGFTCAEVSLGLYLEVKVQVGIVKIKLNKHGVSKMEFDVGACLTLPSQGKGKITLIQPVKWHWDREGIDSQNIFGGLIRVEQCRLEDRKVVFDATSGRFRWNNSRYIEQTYNVNSVIRPPLDPERRGYKFGGWFVDIKKSGLQGSNYRYNFGTMRMPYLHKSDPPIGNNGAWTDYPLYLYAEWIDLYPVTSITLDRDSITGFSNVGTTEKIAITEILPTNANNKDVKWSSSNTSIATVDQKGNVRLRNAGTAVITCTSVGNPSVKATCNVTVKQSPTGITLNKNNIFRYSDNMVGEQLTATVLPSTVIDKSVTWESSNTDVASVSNTGYVTLNGLGTATITCRSVTHPNIKATCTVAVRQAVTSITLNKESEQRTNADMSTIKLVATVTPTNAWNKALTWTSNNTNVATVSTDGTVTPKGVGTAVITCASVSNPDVTATFTLQIIQAVTDITLNEKSVTRYSDETTPIQLVAAIEPADAGNKSVTWSSSDPSVITVDANGLVTIVGTGDKKEAHAIITCRSVSNPDVIAECRFTVLQAVTRIDLSQTTINTTVDEINPAYLSATV